MKLIRASLVSAIFFGVMMAVSTQSSLAQVPQDVNATTEQSCKFGMGKDEPSQQCEVPFPAGCKVANFPGSDQPWTTISKGGHTQCRFDEKQSDWKSRIVGTCSRCKSQQCSAAFSVRFDCTQ